VRAPFTIRRSGANDISHLMHWIHRILAATVASHGRNNFRDRADEHCQRFDANPGQPGECERAEGSRCDRRRRWWRGNARA
jgi:hypothetical protein